MLGCLLRINFFLLICSFLTLVKANESYVPGTPSSSYNFNYNIKINEKKKFNTKINKIINDEKVNKRKIIVQGNNRLEDDVIIRDSNINKMNINNKALSIAIKNLYKTGYFEDVQIFDSENTIVINVIENPIIDIISIEGNNEIKDEILFQEIELKSRSVFSSDKIKSDVKKIQNIYRRQGFFSTFVEPKYIKLDQNRVNLVYEITEGKEAKIRRINFINNEVFSDSTLEDVISSKESRWYEFWGSTDKFDQDRINYDKDLLRKYYLDNGYVDFEVLSVNSSLVNNRKEFVINFYLKEGERFKVDDVKFKSSIRNLRNENLVDLLEIEKGDWFNSEKIEKTVSKITDKASEYGFAFVEVLPKIKKKKKKISITFEIQEGKKIYINKINIKGNLKTEDEIIRREIELVEGDAFNLSKIRDSEQNLRTLGLFENAQINFNEGTAENKSNLEVEVTEASTGEFSVGAGFSSIDGVLGNIGIKESNLLGQAKELGLNLGLSTRRSTVDLSYTDPFFLGNDFAAGFDLFDIRQNNKIYSGYRKKSLGFKLRAGYEIYDDLRHFTSYELRKDRIHDVSDNSSIYVKDQEGKRVTSVIGQAIQYDKLNDRLNPTDGYRVRFDVDYYGLGGNANHIKTEFRAANFYRISDQWILGNFIEAGFIYGMKEIKINDRFFLNGDRMRGFKNLGIGPRDISTSDALGGETYYVSRNELNFPLGLPDDLGLKGLIFGDIGTVYNTAASSSDVKDESSLRAAAGVGLSWLSPFGPVKFYLSKAILKEKYDKKEIFRFSFGTTY